MIEMLVVPVWKLLESDRGRIKMCSHRLLLSFPHRHVSTEVFARIEAPLFTAAVG